MYSENDLYECCHDVVDHAYKSAAEFITERKARAARISLEAVEACSLILQYKNTRHAFNQVLNIGADICELCAEESEKHTSMKALKTAITCRKCAKIARSMISPERRAA